MYGFPCAHCGQKELFHILGDDLKLHQNKDEWHLRLDTGWSMEDYGEEFEGVDDLHKHKMGYRKSFKNCQEFVYSKKISDRKLIMEALERPTTMFFLDKKLETRVQEIIRKKEEEPGPLLSLCSSVYIMIGRNGVSRCYVGD